MIISLRRCYLKSKVISRITDAFIKMKCNKYHKCDYSYTNNIVLLQKCGEKLLNHNHSSIGNAEDHLTDAFSNLPASKIVQYQQMMKHSDQIPMCMSSSGSVFSDLVSNFIRFSRTSLSTTFWIYYSREFSRKIRKQLKTNNQFVAHQMNCETTSLH